MNNESMYWYYVEGWSGKVTVSVGVDQLPFDSGREVNWLVKMQKDGIVDPLSETIL